MTQFRDLRAKITPEAWAALNADSRSTGRDVSEIVRDILHEWALQRIEAATLLNANLESEGLPGIVGERRR